MKKHKIHITGATCGSRPPQYQAACYRSRHQKVPKFALDAEKKAKGHLKLKVKKPKVIGKHIKAPKLKISKKISIKKPVLKMKKHKIHITGATCGSRPPQYQAACYRSRHQKVPKFALDAEKKAKAHLKLKVKKPKVIGKRIKAPKLKISKKISIKK